MRSRRCRQQALSSPWAAAQPSRSRSFLNGGAGSHGYSSLSIQGASAIGVGEFTSREVGVTITDDWSLDETVRLHRHVQENRGPDAINLALNAAIEFDDSRPLVPGMIYSPTQWRRGEMFLFADHRPAFPIASVWSPAMKQLFWLARTRPGEHDERAERTRGANRYRERTQLDSVGFQVDKHPRLIARWPYAEEDRSAMLDALGTPVVAFYPLESGLDFVLEYELGLRPAAEFSEAIRLVVRRILSLAEPKPSNGDLSLSEAIDLRLDSAAKTFRTTPAGFSGFMLIFDPQRGYESEAKAFGASFAEKLTERHVRFLAPLAYLSPRVIEAIAEGRAPADLTVTRLARNLPLSWAEQEEQFGLV
jgi:hypothetical protein